MVSHMEMLRDILRQVFPPPDHLQPVAIKVSASCLQAPGRWIFRQRSGSHRHTDQLFQPNASFLSYDLKKSRGATPTSERPTVFPQVDIPGMGRAPQWQLRARVLLRIAIPVQREVKKPPDTSHKE